MTDGDDRLLELRQQLEQIDERPLDERPAVFEAAHRALAVELNRLEEV